VKAYAGCDDGSKYTDHREAQGWQCGKHASQHAAKAQVGADLRKHWSDRDRGWPEVEGEGRNSDQDEDPP
jgi:hypothetical protein